MVSQENGSRVMSQSYLSPIPHPLPQPLFFFLLCLGLDPVEILGQFQGTQGCIKITLAARKTRYCNSRPFCRAWLGQRPPGKADVDPRTEAAGNTLAPWCSQRNASCIPMHANTCVRVCMTLSMKVSSHDLPKSSQFF